MSEEPAVSADADRPNRWPWPPILYAVMPIATFALGRLVPLDWLPEGMALRGIGGVLAVLGIGIAAAAIFRFRALGTPVDPTGRPTALSTGGIYRFTRNPMYLGAVVMFAGIALALRSSWLLLLVPALAILLEHLAIRREEAYLERRFGEAYRAYKARVRRWV